MEARQIQRVNEAVPVPKETKPARSQERILKDRVWDRQEDLREGLRITRWIGMVFWASLIGILGQWPMAVLGVGDAALWATLPLAIVGMLTSVGIFIYRASGEYPDRLRGRKLRKALRDAENDLTEYYMNGLGS
jgi:hypothetical protein